jgi:lipid-A-disaccharide synthase
MTESNCLIIAGEKSGEEHALSFFNDLQNLTPNTKYWGVGGDELESAGVELIYNLKEFSSWGISEVIFKIPFYSQALKKIEDLATARNCKTAILIDFQTFNLKLAKRLKKKGVKVLYYVAPQAWVWKEWRANVLGKTVHTLFTILNFEKKWFQKRGVSQIVSIDHPLYLTYKNQIIPKDLGNIKNREMKLLLLPGSRDFEVKGLLPVFYRAARNLQESYKLKISLIKSPNIDEKLYEPYLDIVDDVYRSDEIAEAMNSADIAIAASGTITLATALFEIPTVVCYKTSLLNYWIYLSFINYKGHASLGNIVHQEEIFPELIQDRATEYNIERAVKKWLDDTIEFKKIVYKLKDTKGLVSGEDVVVPKYIADVLSNGTL